jgi:hypothetical protein
MAKGSATVHVLPLAGGSGIVSSSSSSSSSGSTAGGTALLPQAWAQGDSRWSAALPLTIASQGFLLQ